MHPLIKQAAISNLTIFGEETTHGDNTSNSTNKKVKSFQNASKNEQHD
jgi:hypothetical protein